MIAGDGVKECGAIPAAEVSTPEAQRRDVRSDGDGDGGGDGDGASNPGIAAQMFPSQGLRGFHSKPSLHTKPTPSPEACINISMNLYITHRMLLLTTVGISHCIHFPYSTWFVDFVKCSEAVEGIGCGSGDGFGYNLLELPTPELITAGVRFCVFGFRLILGSGLT